MKTNHLRKIAVLAAIAMIIGIFSGCTQNEQKKPFAKNNKAEMRPEPTISLYINETGEKKQIKMEDYIQGVVAAEMDTKWPVNALAAQAILARTFTLKQIKDKGGVPQHGTDASTSVEEFQAYDPSRINDNVRKAVQMTRGEVVKYKGRYINAWFSACDGGTEASAAEGLSYRKEKTPYIKAGAKDGCLEITVPENKSWTASFPVSLVRGAVQKVNGQDPGNISAGNVSVARRGPTGRAEVLRIGKANVGAAALRLALGNDKMRSIYLDNISVQGGNVVMTGKGYGHGVGMCQWGAKKMASEGSKPEEIVSFYFKNVQIQKIWK